MTRQLNEILNDIGDDEAIIIVEDNKILFKNDEYAKASYERLLDLGMEGISFNESNSEIETSSYEYAKDAKDELDGGIGF